MGKQKTGTINQKLQLVMKSGETVRGKLSLNISFAYILLSEYAVA